MKKFLLSIVALLCTTAGFAQFEQGKLYAGASLTGINLSYSGSEKFHVGLEANGGYFIMDNVLLTAQVGINQYSGSKDNDTYNLGGGVRYYIIQNGIYLEANAKYKHMGKGLNDFVPGLEVGYAFFLNRSVTIEPAIYYDQSFKSHSDYSKVGARIGIGIYLYKD